MSIPTNPAAAKLFFQVVRALEDRFGGVATPTLDGDHVDDTIWEIMGDAHWFRVIHEPRAAGVYVNSKFVRVVYYPTSGAATSTSTTSTLPPWGFAVTAVEQIPWELLVPR